jgi:hypothetical protein
MATNPNVIRWMGSQLQTLVAAFAQRVSAAMAARLQALAKIGTELVQEVEQADDNRELTDIGKREAVKRVVARAEEQIAPHQREAERLDGEAEALRVKAGATPASELSEVAELAAQREVRDYLRGVDRVLIPAMYLAAIEADAPDWLLVRAIENAPGVLRLVGPETLSKGRDAKVRRSSLAPRLRELEDERDALRQIVNAARAELKHVAAARGYTDV